jgi:hypothetical protein
MPFGFPNDIALESFPMWQAHISLRFWSSIQYIGSDCPSHTPVPQRVRMTPESRWDKLFALPFSVLLQVPMTKYSPLPAYPLCGKITQEISVMECRLSGAVYTNSGCNLEEYPGPRFDRDEANGSEIPRRPFGKRERSPSNS